jgi:hypothetical protein
MNECILTAFDRYIKEYDKGNKSPDIFKESIKELIFGGVCVCCGSKDNLTFHHIDPSKKSIEIPQLIRRLLLKLKSGRVCNVLNSDRYYDEFNNLELLCLDCHKREHGIDKKKRCEISSNNDTKKNKKKHIKNMKECYRSLERSYNIERYEAGKTYERYLEQLDSWYNYETNKLLTSEKGEYNDIQICPPRLEY